MRHLVILFLSLALQLQAATTFLFTKNVDGTTTFPTVTPANSSLFGVNGAGAVVMVPNTTFESAGAAATAQAFSIQRANHTGTQSYTTITGLGVFATGTDAANLTGTLAAARIADASLSIAKTSGLQTALDGKATTTLSNVDPAAALYDVFTAKSVINAQPFCAAKIAAWTGSSSTPPLKGALVSDSTGTNMGLGPKMKSAGMVGLSIASESGTITKHGIASEPSRFDYWTNGQALTFATGATAEFTVSGNANGDLQGDTGFVAYIKKSGGGSFDVEYQLNKDGTWRPFGAGSSKTWTANSTTDIFTSTAHGYVTGTAVQIASSGGTLPTAVGGNLAASTTYSVILIDANTYKLARTLALAKAGTAIDLSDSGSGTQTSVSYGSLNVDTANASTIGAAMIASIPTNNYPFCRLRITNVATANVTVITTGIYYTNGGGVVWMPVCSFAGTDVSQAIQTPLAVFTPIWTALAPDFVISAWADPASDWETGGAWRTFYANAKAAKNATDFIQFSPNVSRDGEATYADVRIKQRAWALAFDETYVNNRDWSPDYATCDARGWMANDGSFYHFNATGHHIRNMHIFADIPLYQWDLGAMPAGQPNTASANPLFSLTSGSQMDSSPISAKRQIRSWGPSAGMTVGDRNQLFSSAFDWTMYASGNAFGSTLYFNHQNGDRGSLDQSGNLAVSKVILTTSTPASAAASGTTGMVTWDSSYIYICTATNTWKRVAIATW